MKPFLAICASIVLVSCNSPFGLNKMGYKEKSYNLPEAWAETAKLEYQEDETGYWKSPDETLADGGGDCEDLATFMVYLLGDGSDLVLIKSCGISHCIVRYNGKYLDAPDKNNCSKIEYYRLEAGGILTQYGQTWVISRVIDYAMAMEISTNKGTKSMGVKE